ncbi:unannotated protein [freshwater metagenome]|uniref:DNA 3'-5' helicase n=1 Tax=freshwater metagenome TaxID=449393 RepID=A0A6J7DP45_9ZZZZ
MALVGANCQDDRVPSADQTLQGLDPEQREVALAPFGPVVVRAGAGTGKTRAITHRIAYGVHAGIIDPSQVLAVTFTTRAAGELGQRLRALGVGGVQARTFHSAALRQLTHFWPRAIGGAMPEVMASKAQVIAMAASRVGVTTNPALIRDLASEIEWAKVSQVVPALYEQSCALREPPLEAAQFAKVYEAYEQVKQDRGRLDFEDILLLTVALLEERSEVAREVQARYRHFVVDEYQDVNPLQDRLLTGWLGGGESITVVGDSAQTIYSFTGAQASYLKTFSQRFPGAVQLSLVRNYRSTPEIVGTANAILKATNQDQQALTLQSQREHGKAPTVLECSDEDAEANAVVQRILEQQGSGVALSRMAILFRINAQSETYEQALAQAGIPYVLRGGERFFDRPEVRQALTLIRGAARALPGGLLSSQSVPEPEKPLGQSVRDALTSMGWDSQPPTGVGAVRDRWESLLAIAGLADEMQSSTPQATLADFVLELSERAAAQHAPAVDGVTLASIHAAKGLEWDCVYLVGLVDGTLPLIHATTPDQIAEERRLFYVGVTRARDELCLSWSRSRSGRGTRERSRFLASVSDTVTGSAPTKRTPAKPSAGPKKPVRCRVCDKVITVAAERKLKRCLTCTVDFDEELYERARLWRALEAKRASVPAFVVFTDATLQAIVEAEPAQEAEFLAIPGVGHNKLLRYGTALQILLEGGSADDALMASAQGATQD